MLNVVNTQEISHINGYELTNALIRGGLGKLKLSNSASMVLLYLCSCYNAKNKTVFPKIITVALSLGITQMTVKRAIKELVNAGCILKTKKDKKQNAYIITPKVLNLSNKDNIKTDKSVTKNEDKNVTLLNKINHEIETTTKKNKIEQLEVKKEVVLTSNLNNDLEILDFVVNVKKQVIKSKKGYLTWLNKTENAEIKQNILNELYEHKQKLANKEKFEQAQRQYLKDLQESKARFIADNTKLEDLYPTKEKALFYLSSRVLYGGFDRQIVKNPTFKTLVNKFGITKEEI